VRASPLGPAAVQVVAEGDQVDRHGLPPVADGVGERACVGRVQRQAAAGVLQAAVAQFLEQDQQPALARQCRAAIARRQRLPLRRKAPPRAQAAVPRAVDRLVEPLACEQVVSLRRQPIQPAALSDALEQVRRQDAAFGFDGGEVGAGLGLHRVFKKLLTNTV